MILKIVLAILGWLMANPVTAAGLVFGAAGLGVGIGCLMVAKQIYKRQKQEGVEAHEQQERNIMAYVSTVVPKVEALFMEHGSFTPAMRTDLARVLWTSVTGYVSQTQASQRQTGYGFIGGGSGLPSGKQAQATGLGGAGVDSKKSTGILGSGGGGLGGRVSSGGQKQ